MAGVETFSRQGGLLRVTNPFVTRSRGKRGILFGGDRTRVGAYLLEILDFLLPSGPGPGARKASVRRLELLAIRNAILRLLSAFVEQMGCFIEGVSSHRRSGWARLMGVFFHHSSPCRGTWDQAVNAGVDPGT